MFRNKQELQEIASSKHSDELSKPVKSTDLYEHEKSFSEEDICFLHKIMNDRKELVPMKDIDEHLVSSVAPMEDIDKQPASSQVPMEDISKTENIYVITIHHHKEQLSLLNYYINQIDNLNYVQKKYYNDVKFELYFFTSLPHKNFYDEIPKNIIKNKLSAKFVLSLKYKTIYIQLEIAKVAITGTYSNIILNIVNIIPFDIQIASVEFNISEEELTCECNKHKNLVYNNNQIGTKRFVSQLMLFHEQLNNNNKNYFHWQIDYGTKFGIPYHINYVNVKGAQFKFSDKTVLTTSVSYTHLCNAKQYLSNLIDLGIKFDKIYYDNIPEILLSKFDFSLFFMNHYNNSEFMHFTLGSPTDTESELLAPLKSEQYRGIESDSKSTSPYKPKKNTHNSITMITHYDKCYISNIKLFLKYYICYNPYLIESNEDLFLSNLLCRTKYNKPICSFYFFTYIKCQTTPKIPKESFNPPVGYVFPIHIDFLNIYNNYDIDPSSKTYRINDNFKSNCTSDSKLCDTFKRIDVDCSVLKKQDTNIYTNNRHNAFLDFAKYFIIKNKTDSNKFKLKIHHQPERYSIYAGGENSDRIVHAKTSLFLIPNQIYYKVYYNHLIAGSIYNNVSVSKKNYNINEDENKKENITLEHIIEKTFDAYNKNSIKTNNFVSLFDSFVNNLIFKQNVDNDSDILNYCCNDNINMISAYYNYVKSNIFGSPTLNFNYSPKKVVSINLFFNEDDGDFKNKNLDLSHGKMNCTAKCSVQEMGYLLYDIISNDDIISDDSGVTRKRPSRTSTESKKKETSGISSNSKRRKHGYKYLKYKLKYLRLKQLLSTQ